jgi:membrane protease YdiL (CAAX protease family)
VNLNLTRIARYHVSFRLGIFVLMLLSLWLPVAVPVYWLWSSNRSASLGITLLLYVDFIWLLWFWGRTVHRQARPFQTHGLVDTQQNWLELFRGLCLGLTSLLGLFLIEGWAGWVMWQSSAQALLKVVLEGFAVALGVGLAEELLFRGWLVDELQ